MAVVTFAVAGSIAFVVYSRWRGSEARSFLEALDEHVVGFQDLAPGKELSLLSFPATERFHDVPRFHATLNDWRVRERPFARDPAPGVARIIAVGESSTFGTGLEIGQRFTELLAVALEARHPGCCEVLNAGRMGMMTPTAVRFVQEEVVGWRPKVLVYDSMANDLVDPDRPGEIDYSPKRVRAYEKHLRDLVASCAAQGIAIVFWANTIAQRGDPLAGFRASMERVARESGSGYVDLAVLYEAHPATKEEVAAFLAEPNWTQWYDVVLPPELSLERVALHTDWVHPNRFGSQRLAAGLLPLVERALELGVP